jgi:large subunit ribosomal protein L18
MAQTKTKKRNPRLRSKMRTRKKLQGADEKPRICVFRSSKHIYLQLISDESRKTIVSASTLDKEVLDALNKLEGGIEKNSTKSMSAAKLVGQIFAKRAKEKNVNSVLFDRNGFVYTGRINRSWCERRRIRFLSLFSPFGTLIGEDNRGFSAEGPKRGE